MNKNLVKLSLIKHAFLIKKGQLLMEDGNLFVAEDVKLIKKGSKYNHRISLKVAEFTDSEGLFYPDPNFLLVDLDEDEILSRFGIGRKGKILPGVISGVIEDLANKAGRPEIFDSSVNYDKILKGFSNKVLSRSVVPIDPQDQDDMIINVILQTITPKTVKNFDPEKGDLIKFFGGMFQKRLLNEMKKYVTQKVKEVRNRFDDFTDEEAMDYLKEMGGDPFAPHQETQEEVLEFKQLIQQLTKHIQKQRDGERLMPVLEGTMQGEGLTDIAKELGVSKSIISQRLKRLREVIVEFGKKSGNDLLVNLMIEFSKTKKHADRDVSFIWDVFEKYKKSASCGKPHKKKPQGEVIKIKKSDFGVDKMSEDFVSNAILGGETSMSKMSEDLEQFLDELDLQDELIEMEDGKIIGLQIVDEHRLEDVKRAHKAGSQKRLMLQVEEWLWRNEKKMPKKQLLKEAEQKFQISSENASYVYNQLHGGDGADFLGKKEKKVMKKLNIKGNKSKKSKSIYDPPIGFYVQVLENAGFKIFKKFKSDFVKMIHKSSPRTILNVESTDTPYPVMISEEWRNGDLTETEGKLLDLVIKTKAGKFVDDDNRPTDLLMGFGGKATGKFKAGVIPGVPDGTGPRCNPKYYDKEGVPGIPDGTGPWCNPKFFKEKEAGAMKRLLMDIQEWVDMNKDKYDTETLIEEGAKKFNIEESLFQEALEM